MLSARWYVLHFRKWIHNFYSSPVQAESQQHTPHWVVCLCRLYTRRRLKEAARRKSFTFNISSIFRRRLHSWPVVLEPSMGRVPVTHHLAWHTHTHTDTLIFLSSLQFALCIRHRFVYPVLATPAITPCPCSHLLSILLPTCPARQSSEAPSPVKPTWCARSEGRTQSSLCVLECSANLCQW